MTSYKLWNKLYHYKMHHALLWICYFAFWVILYRDYYTSILPLIFNTSVYFAFTAAAFYITTYVLFPRFLYNNQYAPFFLSFAGTILMFSFGLALVLLQIYKHHNQPDIDFSGLFQIAFFSILTMVLALSAVKLITDKLRSDRRNRIVERQRLESELQYLKAQVNPHFLFNAINSVYFLIKKDPDQAAETLIKLSDLLRFQLYDCSGESIAIEKEIDYLMNFIELERIRKGQKIKVDIDQGDGLSGFVIAPFLIIPFLENAFKYVSNSNKMENIIRVSFRVSNRVFTVKISNTTDNVKAGQVGGIGLKNVKRRLELLYPGKHKLEIAEQQNEYSVTLSLEV